MAMIKVFRFEVSNASSSSFDDDKKSLWYANSQKRLVTENSIENQINSFLEGKELIDIKINTIDVQYHNNARGNTVHLVYTVIWR